MKKKTMIRRPIRQRLRKKRLKRNIKKKSCLEVFSLLLFFIIIRFVKLTIQIIMLIIVE